MWLRTCTPSISVIIPTLNRCAILPRALDSILSQTVLVDEIIVIDNGSTDRTIPMLESEYPRVIILNEKKRGVSAARNKGINYAKGTWIALVDSDDAWLPLKLEKQLQHSEKNQGHRLIHTDEVWYRYGKQVNQSKKHEKSGGDIFEQCLRLCCISPSSTFIHKSLFEDIGRFDEDLPACEDYDLWLRICAREEVLYVNEPLTVKHSDCPNQLSKQYWGMDRFRIMSLEKILSQKFLRKNQERATLRILVQKIKIMINGAIKRDNKSIIKLYSPKLEKWESVILNEL